MTNSADPDQKPTDLDLHCLLKQGMSYSTREGLIISRKEGMIRNRYNYLNLYLVHWLHNIEVSYYDYTKC